MHLLAFIIPASVYYSLQQNDWRAYSAVLVAFGLIPLFEIFFKGRQTQAVQRTLPTWWFDSILYSQIPLQFFLLFEFLNKINQPEANFVTVGYTCSMGIACGVLGINAAHELGHRKAAIDQFFAKLLLSSSLYTHFFVEHNYGHHRQVATRKDAATARLGEMLYVFWFRSVLQGFLSALHIEKNLLRKRFPIYRNPLWQGFALQAALLGFIYMLFGFAGLQAFCAAALVGILLLETVNYIEHYGLERKRLPDSNSYESVKSHHSWNSNHPLGRWVLFELSRHSDHHHNSFKKYYQLQSIDQAPQMPTGYPGMMLLSLIPPIWFAIMNRRLAKLPAQAS